MKVIVKYFASIRERIGSGSEQFDTASATLGALRDELIARGGAHAESLARGRAVRMALNQVGTVSAPEPRLLAVNVWDKGLVVSVAKAIREAGLGLNPAPDGQLVRVPIPELTAERRAELAKLAHKYAEHGRVAVRNVRRDGMEALKKAEKDHKISQDEHRQKSDEVQKLTDRYVKQVDEVLAHKEKEIKTV